MEDENKFGNHFLSETRRDDINSNTEANDRREPHYQCQKCDFQTIWKNSLVIHEQSQHKGTKYPCLECGQMFTQKCGLSQHEQSIHMGKRYACD